MEGEKDKVLYLEDIMAEDLLRLSSATPGKISLSLAEQVDVAVKTSRRYWRESRKLWQCRAFTIQRHIADFADIEIEQCQAIDVRPSSTWSWIQTLGGEIWLILMPAP